MFFLEFKESELRIINDVISKPKTIAHMKNMPKVTLALDDSILIEDMRFINPFRKVYKITTYKNNSLTTIGYLIVTLDNELTKWFISQFKELRRY